VWSSYSARQAAQLIGLSESAVRSCIRDGLVGVATDIPVQLTFRDLATLRLIKRLVDGGLPLANVRRELLRIATTLQGQSLSELPIEVRGSTLVIRGSAAAAVGQMDLFAVPAPISSEAGQLHTLPVPLPATAEASNPVLQPVPIVTADEWFMRALELEDSDSRAAIDAYRRGLRLRPDASESWVNLGRLLAEASDGAGAAECFRTAAELDPNDATTHYNLGVVAQDDGRESEAIMLYRRAIELDPSLAEAHYNLATLFDQTGDPRAAIRHINEYRKLTKGPHRTL